MNLLTPLEKSLIKLGVVLGLLAGVYLYGHHRGAAEVQVQFDAFKNQEYAAAEKQVATLQAAARAAEQAHTEKVAQIVQQATVEKTENANRANATIADLRAGNVRLSVQLAAARAGAQRDGQAAGGTAGAADQGAGELPLDTAEFLIGEASRADDLAIRFNEAVDVIAQDRATCNALQP